MEYFNQTKDLFKTSIQSILRKNDSYEIDEAALPAYAHKNPIIDFIFWQRVRIAYQYVANHPQARVLDFGCGTGLLSYALAKKGISVVANDLVFDPLNLMKKEIEFPSSIEFIEGDLMQISYPDHSFDYIIALDVLEHINNLDDYILLFKKLLKPGGSIIVSGPTENFLYKIGRKLAGEKFTGDYHVNNIHNIKKSFSKSMDTKTLRKLIWPFTLFELFVAREGAV